MTKDEVAKIIHVLSQHFLQPDVQSFNEREALEAGAGDQKGWYFRLSAPGYLDCTDWYGPYDTEDEANEELAETFGDDISEPEVTFQ